MDLLASVPLAVVIALVAAAFVAGWVDAVVGGGGLIQLPALLIGLADQSVPVISGTNKLASASGTFVAALTYLRKVRVDWFGIVPLVVAAYAGSTAGAQLVQLVSRDWFTPIVLVALVVVGVYTLRRPQLGLHHHLAHTGWAQAWRSAAIGFGVGCYDGFLGPGTGSFLVILLVAVLGYGFLQASVQAKLANLTTNIAAVVVLGSQGHVLWLLGALMALGNLTGAYLGARTALRYGSAFVRKVFLVVVSVLALKLGWDTVVLFAS